MNMGFKEKFGHEKFERTEKLDSNDSLARRASRKDATSAAVMSDIVL